MGIHDIEPVKTSSGTGKSGSSKIVPAAITAVLIIGVVLYFLLTGKEDTSEKGSGQETVSTGDLPGLLAELGVQKSEAVVAFAVNEQVEEFAQSLSQGKSGADAMDALFAGMMELRSRGQWKPFHQREPREETPLSAADLVKKFDTGGESAGGEAYEATSYELASLLHAAGRSLELDTRLVEILRFEGEGKPADEPGKFGRFAVTLGLADFLDSRHAIVLAFGAAKAKVVAQMVEGPMTAMVPASVLQMHPNVDVILDEEAASDLENGDYYREARRRGHG